MDDFDDGDRSKQVSYNQCKRGDSDMDTARQITIEHSHSDAPEWVSTGEAARMLGVGSINTVKRWVAANKLRARRLGGDRGWMQVSRQSIGDLLKSQDPEMLKMQTLQRDWNNVNEAMNGELDAEVMEDLSWRNQTKSGQLPWEKESQKP